jgi:hypothetical protein
MTQNIKLSIPLFIFTFLFFLIVGCGRGDFNPATPHVYLRSQYDLNSYFEYITVAGNYAYVATLDSGISVIKVDDINHPEKVGEYKQCQYVYSIAVSGQYLYAADYGPRMIILDISDPTNPSPVQYDSSLIKPGYISIEGSSAYLECDSALLVYDIGNPISPHLIGELPMTNIQDGFYISGNYAYLESDFSPPYYPLLRIIDISNPCSPIIVGSHPIAGQVSGFLKSGDYLYITRYGLGGCFLLTFDLSNPENPVAIDSISIGSHALGLIERNNFLYLCDNRNGLRVYDINNSSTPNQVSNYDLTTSAFNLTLSGSYLYIANSHSLLIAEIIP